jgi:hypothetical protein
MTGHRLRITLASLCLASLPIGCDEKRPPSPSGKHVPFVADAEKQRAEEYKNRGKDNTAGQIPQNINAAEKPQGDAAGRTPSPIESTGNPR